VTAAIPLPQVRLTTLSVLIRRGICRGFSEQNRWILDDCTTASRGMPRGVWLPGHISRCRRRVERQHQNEAHGLASAPRRAVCRLADDLVAVRDAERPIRVYSLSPSGESSPPAAQRAPAFPRREGGASLNKTGVFEVGHGIAERHPFPRREAGALWAAGGEDSPTMYTPRRPILCC
jgi:hypothetical protein